MSTSDPCGFCLCVCLCRAARYETVVSLSFTIQAKPVIQVGLAARPVKQTQACTLPYEARVAHKVCRGGGPVGDRDREGVGSVGLTFLSTGNCNWE